MRLPSLTTPQFIMLTLSYFVQCLTDTYGGRALSPDEYGYEIIRIVQEYRAEGETLEAAYGHARSAIRDYDKFHGAPRASRSGLLGLPYVSANVDGRSSAVDSLASQIQSKLNSVIADDPDADTHATLCKLFDAYIKHRMEKGERRDNAKRRWDKAVPLVRHPPR